MNLTDLQAAIGIVQLSRIDEMRKKRKLLWDYYDEELKNTSIKLPAYCQEEGNVHAMHLYAVGLPININRDELVWKASQEYNITFGIHYNSIPYFSAYKKYFNFLDPSIQFKNAWDWGKRTISLSLSAGVSYDDAERIVNCLKSLIKK